MKEMPKNAKNDCRFGKRKKHAKKMTPSLGNAKKVTPSLGNAKKMQKKCEKNAKQMQKK